MKARFFMILGALCLAPTLFAQNEVDALRYSTHNLYGTARFISMGGAFGALGGDLSSISINPAGLGIYRRSEFGLSLGFNSAQSSTVYEGKTAMNSDAGLGFGNIGMVGSYPTEDQLWPRVNFAVLYNKTADFNEQISIQGDVEDKTMLNLFVDQVTGIQEADLGNAFPFSATLAYDAWLINPTDSANGFYDHEIPWGQVSQTKTIERSGSMGETVIAGGFNYTDEVYVGLSLGFPSLSYTENSVYREWNLEDGFELDQWSFRDNLVVRGNGFNMKLGMIYKPTDWIRVGAALHSPNWMTVNESYDRNITSIFKNGDTFDIDSPLGNYQYRIKTPARLVGSLALIGGKLGLISADYEMVDYSGMKLRQSRTIFDEYDFSIENETISDIYKPTHNIRLGAEARVFSSLRLRAGAGYATTPFKDGIVESNSPTVTYSGGVGFRRNNFYVEAAFSTRVKTEDYYLYDPSEVSAAAISSTMSQGVVSVGFRY